MVVPWRLIACLGSRWEHGRSLLLIHEDTQTTTTSPKQVVVAERLLGGTFPEEEPSLGIRNNFHHQNTDICLEAWAHDSMHVAKHGRLKHKVGLWKDLRGIFYLHRKWQCNACLPPSCRRANYTWWRGEEPGARLFWSELQSNGGQHHSWCFIVAQPPGCSLKISLVTLQSMLP